MPFTEIVEAEETTEARVARLTGLTELAGEIRRSAEQIAFVLENLPTHPDRAAALKAVAVLSVARRSSSAWVGLVDALDAASVAVVEHALAEGAIWDEIADEQRMARGNAYQSHQRRKARV